MRTRIASQAIALISLLALTACDVTESYRGDGKLIDNGPTAAKDRYVLELGPAHLEATGITSYRIENLPNEEFVVGISLKRTQSAAASINGRPIRAVVALELKDQNGAIVLRREGPLNEWTWSIPVTDDWAFIYGESPTTFFNPKRGPYRLTFAVIKPDANASAYSPMIVAKAGGWK